MRLLIASDLHGSPERALLLRDKVRAQRPDLLVLLGDLLYHGPRNPLPPGYTPRDVAELLRDMGAPIMAVRGNCDAEVDSMVLPFHLAESAWLFVDGLRILAFHGQHLPPEPPFPGITPGTVVLTGHTHTPLARTRGGIFQWNPGSTTLPKKGYPPTYGIYENGEFRVMTLDDQIYLHHSPHAGIPDA